MHIHILGICGTFMGGIAQIARSLGHDVTGSDQNVYPPMSEQLKQQGIRLMLGYSISHLQPAPGLVLVGNSLARGNPALEYTLNQQLPFLSGPEWLYRELLQAKHVLAVSGTHGKTTTTSMLAWILEFAEMNPGFLIGGIAENFGLSARYTDSDYFVIEADEYDTAFSDKRAKFIHYHPKTLIINNIEFDHADIFRDIVDIRRAFHHLVRVLPEQASIIYWQADQEIRTVLDMGCWSETIGFAGVASNWSITATNQDYSQFSVIKADKRLADLNWSLIGEYNAMNALAAIIAAEKVGVSVKQSCRALSKFKSVKRRMECIFDKNGIRLYDDFAHHPTAISKTLQALRQHVGKARIIAIIEPRSNTMRMGIHANTFASSLIVADKVLIFQADNVDWDITTNIVKLNSHYDVFTTIEEIILAVASLCQAGDHIIIMSNGSFDGIHKKLIKALS